ncbi:MAG: AMP-binding protein [Fuerstiella sp.]|nr:AMP-binding protein [Fuerstiella sp.]
MTTSIEQIWCNRESIREIQSRRLRDMLAEIIPRNRFYARKFAGIDVSAIGGLKDLYQLPLTSKQELVDGQTTQPPYGTNLTYPSNRYHRLHQTSGTTGQPMRWLDTAASWNWIMECWRQIYLLAGVTPIDRFFFPFSFGPFIGFWAAFEGAGRIGNFCLAGGGMSTENRLRAMIENEATIVCCTPTYALRMAELAQQNDIDLHESAVRLLVVAGEPGGAIPATRSRIEQAWDARVIDHWGMTEIGSLGIESADRPGGMYLLETEAIAEIVDPETLDPVPEGNIGELLITNLGRTGSPLIRYRTRDLVRASTAKDPADRQLLWLEGGILSRSDDMVTIRGNNVFPSSVEAVLREIDEVAEFRIDVRTVRAMHELVVTVESVSADSGELQIRVNDALRQRLGFACNVKIATPGSLPRFELKGRRFHRE